MSITNDNSGYINQFGLVDMTQYGVYPQNAQGSTSPYSVFQYSTQPGMLLSGQPSAGLFGIGSQPANYDITGAINSVPTNGQFVGPDGRIYQNPSTQQAQTNQNDSLSWLDALFPKKKEKDDDDSSDSSDLVRRKSGGKALASSKLSSEAKEKIKDVAAKINCDPDDLIAVMKAESGCKTTAVNPNGGATGLIQFMPSTAKDLGTTCEDIKKMSDVEQVALAGKYLEKAKKTAKMSTDQKLDKKTLHALIFMPANAKKDVLCKAGSKEYEANKKALDKEGKGYISKDDFA